MPIELKWVRQNPQLVEEWQQLRGESGDVVQVVLQNDEAARSLLQSIQRSKRSLAAVKQQLRPVKKNDRDESSSATASSREDLLEEKKKIEERIVAEEKVWREATRTTEALLWKVASQVDLPSTSQDQEPDKDFVATEMLPCTNDGDEAMSQLGMELQHAWKSHAMQSFAEYPSVQLPRGLRVERVVTKDCNKKSTGVIGVDAAHSLWGCSFPNGDGAGTPMDDRLPQFRHSCPICMVAATEIDSPTRQKV
ncbi:MAG: hypothetical protein SGILL_007058, partial [Bacillariaceae sp.]